jgi:L-rhamnose isomerase
MTQEKYRQYEDDESKSPKRLKHARNEKGKGMKVLNSYVEEDYDDEDLDYDFESYYEDDNTNT